MTHLTKRNGVYYFRRKIPLELRAYFDGKAELTFSLETKNRAEAEPMARKWSVAYDEEFAQARRNALQTTNAGLSILSPIPKPKITDGLTIDDFDVLVSRYINRLRQSRERAASSLKTYEQFRQNLGNEIVNLTEYLEGGEHPLEDIQRPLWHVEAQLKALRAVLEGNAPQSVGLLHAYAPPPAPMQSQAPATALLTSFDTLLADWANERQPEARTVTQYTRVMQKLQEHTGVALVEKLTKQHVVTYKDKLIAEGTTTVTTNNYLVNLTTLLNYALNNALIDTNPAAGIRVIVRDEDKLEREPFSVPQLNALFSSPVFSAGVRPTGGKGHAAYWLPLLGLFTGARLNELCQLNKSDVRQEQYHDEHNQLTNCWVMDITDSGTDQKLKNSKSKRRILSCCRFRGHHPKLTPPVSQSRWG